jgi:hypothetical protein
MELLLQTVSHFIKFRVKSSIDSQITITINGHKYSGMLFIKQLFRGFCFYFIMILLSIYIYWIGNKFLQLTSPSPYKYINSIYKTNQMTANVQAISIIISKLSKIMSNLTYIINIVLIFDRKKGG